MRPDVQPCDDQPSVRYVRSDMENVINAPNLSFQLLLIRRLARGSISSDEDEYAPCS